MSDEQSVYRRVLRRETHSSRAGAAITVAAVLAVVCLAVGAAATWLVLDPSTRHTVASAVEAFDADAAATPAVAAAGGAAVVLGLWLLLLGVLPRRRPRHGRVAGRVAIVTDDRYAADVIVDAVVTALSTRRDLVRATVGRRAAVVSVTPVSGVPVDEEAAGRAAADATSRLGRPLSTRVRVAPRGVIV